jgi:ribose transport system substrate-binding protein
MSKAFAAGLAYLRWVVVRHSHQAIGREKAMLARRIGVILTIALAATVSPRAAWCQEGGAGGEKVIGVSLLTLDNPFFKVIGDHITSEGKKHGYKTVVLSADKDSPKQHSQMKEFIVQKVSAIVISPCESRAIVPAIQEANAAGIPVFTVDIPCLEPGVKIVSQIATDNEGGGKEAARAMIEALGAKGGKVAILHAKKFESCRLRVKGFRAVIEEHNDEGESFIEIVGEYESNGAKDAGFKAGLDAIQKDPNLSGIFAINDPAALGAYTALEQSNKAGKVVLIGFDGQPEGKQAIKEGKIYADPIQFPDKMGIKIVEAIVDHAAGKTPPAEQLIPTALYRKADAEKDRELQ